MTTSEALAKIEKARAAILAELLQRALKQDPAVSPLDERHAHRWHKPQDNYYSGAGEMTCPVCSTGVLSYARSGYNGHVRARCSTTDCVEWVE